MARIRTIKPGFFTSQSNADLPIPARLTYIGLWTYCDDEGRGIDDARLVKAALWPLDDGYSTKKVEADLVKLAKAGKIKRYKAGGKKVLSVVDWEHQRINRRTKSLLPSEADVTAPDSLTEDDVSPPDSITDDSPPEGNREVSGKGTGIPSLTVGVSPTTSSSDSTEVVLTADSKPPAAWEAIVGERLSLVDTSGTWDLIGAYIESWDFLVNQPPFGQDVMGNLIALTCDYVERTIGEPIDKTDRGRIAMLVRSHGKAALLGYSRALGATDEESPKSRFVYARGVVQSFIRELEAAR